MPDLTFKHSGAMGDIIYALPCMNALGGGILYLDINGGRDDPFVVDQSIEGTTHFNQVGYDFLRPLLVRQPCIRDIRVWNHETVDYNLDSARTLNVDRKANLAAVYLRKFGLDEEIVHAPWLRMEDPPIKLERDVIINRTPRYNSKYVVWELNKQYWMPRSIFIGHPIEHEIFQKTFEVNLPFHAAVDAIEIARILQGSTQLIGNQSFVMALAIGLGVRYIQEVYEFCPNCVFKRENAIYM